MNVLCSALPGVSSQFFEGYLREEASLQTGNKQLHNLLQREAKTQEGAKRMKCLLSEMVAGQSKELAGNREMEAVARKWKA